MVLLHAVATEKALRLHVSPLVSFEPANLAIQVRVSPEPEDRWIVVQTDSGDFERLSGFTITNDQRLYVVSWPRVPAGEYDVRAAIGSGDRARATDVVRVTVVSRF